MDATEVHDRAADILDFEREWGRSKLEDERGRICILGAIYLAATNGRTTGTVSIGDIGSDYTEAEIEAIDGAYDLFWVAHNIAPPVWNDNWCTGGGEAAEKLRLTAKYGRENPEWREDLVL